MSRGVEGPGPIRPDAPAATPPPGGGEDRVTVSDTARELARLRSELGPVDLLRADRVASLQDVMAKGQYSADPPRVARDFLGEILAQLLS
ncbi:MAG TPA: flagellar biosynthesis anti-sigma factor FlgM [Candidatus Binatus sp.]|nr:flagellar biosynthesis anti-sigma factor FlgM [Candidatus Binatus sp.]